MAPLKNRVPSSAEQVAATVKLLLIGPLQTATRHWLSFPVSHLSGEIDSAYTYVPDLAVVRLENE